MWKYLFTKLLLMIPVIFVVSVCVFAIMHLIPGDAAYMILGEQATPKAVAELRRQLGLDQSLPVQYINWVSKLFQGDLGRSIFNNVDVLSSILERLPATLFLSVTAILLSILIAIPMGTLAGIRAGSVGDLLTTAFTMAGIAIPSFLLGILLLYVFSYQLRWLPLMGYVSPAENLLESLRHIFLPAVTLGAMLAATSTRFVRSSVLEVMGKEYVTTARAKGLSESVTIRRHVLKNALSPVVTIVGLQLGTLFGGAMIVETIFAIPGIGRLVVNAVFERDFPVVQGVVLFMAIGVLVVNLLVDMLYTVLDPRVDLSR